MRLFLSALPLLAVTPALAQQATGSDPVVNLQRAAPPPPADDPRRQGPELDVFRGTATPTPTPTPHLFASTRAIARTYERISEVDSLLTSDH